MIFAFQLGFWLLFAALLLQIFIGKNNLGRIYLQIRTALVIIFAGVGFYFCLQKSLPANDGKYPIAIKNLTPKGIKIFALAYDSNNQLLSNPENMFFGTIRPDYYRKIFLPGKNPEYAVIGAYQEDSLYSLHQVSLSELNKDIILDIREPFIQSQTLANSLESHYKDYLEVKNGWLILFCFYVLILIIHISDMVSNSNKLS